LIRPSVFCKTDAEDGSRTHTGLPPMVFETTASAIPPLRLDSPYYTIDQPTCQPCTDSGCHFPFDIPLVTLYNNPMPSPIEPVPTQTVPPPSKQASLRSWGMRLIGMLLLAFLLGVLWNAKFRGTGWTHALNPLNWFRHSRSDELYLVPEALLQRGNPALPEIALTFDDGPHTDSRGTILDTLKHFGVHATFFDVGGNMQLHPDLVMRTLAGGHEIANHSANHLRLDGLAPLQRHREINDADIAFCSVTGNHLSFLRPPGMRYNDQVLSDTHALGYIVVGYTNAAKDFELDQDSTMIAERSLTNLKNGGILLLHDYPSTAAALPSILEGITKRGYRCVTVSEMLDHLPEPMRTSARQFQQKVSE
jgi:peptidoglycan/xylan/chitin deacetylase (PgdA/CDA1 family)